MAGLMPAGVSVSAGAGVSIPDNWWDIGGYQAFLTGEVSPMGGGGAYVGVGAAISRSTSDGPLPLVDGTKNYHAEFNIGYGLAAGAGVSILSILRRGRPSVLEP
jgi:hypothetical protein